MVATHLQSYLSVDDTRKVLRLHQAEIARFVHAQMQKHFWQDTDVDYEVVVTRVEIPPLLNMIARVGNDPCPAIRRLVELGLKAKK
jgi:hypothetical protein